MREDAGSSVSRDALPASFANTANFRYPVCPPITEWARVLAFPVWAGKPGDLSEPGERHVEVKVVEGVPQGIEMRLVDDTGQSGLHGWEGVHRIAVVRLDQAGLPPLLSLDAWNSEGSGIS